MRVEYPVGSYPRARMCRSWAPSPPPTGPRILGPSTMQKEPIAERRARGDCPADPVKGGTQDGVRGWDRIANQLRIQVRPIQLDPGCTEWCLPNT
jgi:hypothetical protein